MPGGLRCRLFADHLLVGCKAKADSPLNLNHIMNGRPSPMPLPMVPSKPSHKVESWNLRFQFKRSFQNQNKHNIHLTFIRHGRSLLPVLLQPLLHLGSGLWPKPCQGIAAQLQALTPKRATYSDHTNRILDS